MYFTMGELETMMGMMRMMTMTTMILMDSHAVTADAYMSIIDANHRHYQYYMYLHASVDYMSKDNTFVKTGSGSSRTITHLITFSRSSFSTGIILSKELEICTIQQFTEK